ncbi:Efflux pump aflT [Colletotrichum orbiculare MAFF 240422]|uniref:Efflux pump aflT n=1 Tax=Colletotrichum orbiculare (strain 104-T / ATCC 96160 / CBS 514.97 / LARS 414 / MAFF 240422) TaxID=1213857 RepID=A0A484FGQ2_COLOR|nr:Efflux pump aflT [Colletotrichum orbiculare MAFF 240422]
MKLSKIEGQDVARKMSQFRLVCTMASVLLVWFIVALVSQLLLMRSASIDIGFQDRLIIATAIPAITDEFNSLADIGWYGSAYLLTSTAFLMLYCKVYSLFSIKTSFLAAVVLFSDGSALCAASKTSAVFIFGRMVSGLGSAGIGMGAQVMMVHAVPITHLPHYMGAAGAVFAIASVVGPVVGGALTTYASWRWCFWINLSVAAVCIVAIWHLFENPPMPSDKMKLKDKIAKFDVKIREEQGAERASADAEAVPYEKRNQVGRELGSDNMEGIEEKDVDDDEPSAPLLTREHRYSEVER